MKRTYLPILLTTFSLIHLSGVLDDHLKIISEKPSYLCNQVRNIDFIYLINLDQRPEKFAHCVNELTPYNISPFRFSAVNGWELSLDSLNDLGIKYQSNMPQDLWGTCYLPEHNFSAHHEIMHVPERTYFCHCMSRGAVGIVLSHLSILQDAFNSGYEIIWVMEDDILVIQNPHTISDRIDELDQIVGRNMWDILFTDRDTKNQQGNYVPCLSFARRPNFSPPNPSRFATRTNINNTFCKIGARYGAYSMIINRSGMQKILNFFKIYNLFLPYDMEFYLPENMNIYTLINDVVSTQPIAHSDNGAPNYLSK